MSLAVQIQHPITLDSRNMFLDLITWTIVLTITHDRTFWSIIFVSIHLLVVCLIQYLYESFVVCCAVSKTESVTIALYFEDHVGKVL